MCRRGGNCLQLSATVFCSSQSPSIFFNCLPLIVFSCRQLSSIGCNCLLCSEIAFNCLQFPPQLSLNVFSFSAIVFSYLRLSSIVCNCLRLSSFVFNCLHLSPSVYICLEFSWIVVIVQLPPMATIWHQSSPIFVQLWSIVINCLELVSIIFNFFAISCNCRPLASIVFNFLQLSAIVSNCLQLSPMVDYRESRANRDAKFTQHLSPS